MSIREISIIKCVTSNSLRCGLCIGLKKYVVEAESTKFLALHIDIHLNWKDRIDQVIPKGSEACYGRSSMFHISNINILKFISLIFHSVRRNGIIFWGNSS